MKKLLTLLLALTLTASVFAACGKQNTTQTTDGAPTGPADVLEALESIWGKYTEDRKFYVMGGDMEHIVENGPGSFDKTQTENLSRTLVIPQTWAQKIDSAATMVHMMNANTFTAGAVKLTQGADVREFAAAMEQSLKSNRWICGFPEELRLVDLGGDIVVIAFGAADLLSDFEANLKLAYPHADVLYSEAID